MSLVQIESQSHLPMEEWCPRGLRERLAKAPVEVRLEGSNPSHSINRDAYIYRQVILGINISISKKNIILKIFRSRQKLGNVYFIKRIVEDIDPLRNRFRVL